MHQLCSTCFSFCSRLAWPCSYGGNGRDTRENKNTHSVWGIEWESTPRHRCPQHSLSQTSYKVRSISHCGKGSALIDTQTAKSYYKSLEIQRGKGLWPFPVSIILFLYFIIHLFYTHEPTKSSIYRNYAITTNQCIYLLCIFELWNNFTCYFPTTKKQLYFDDISPVLGHELNINKINFNNLLDPI